MEAACILPLFLWAVLAALYLIEVSVVQVRLVGRIPRGRPKDGVAFLRNLREAFPEEEEGNRCGRGRVVGR